MKKAQPLPDFDNVLNRLVTESLPIRNESVTEQLVRQIKDWALRGLVKPGERLPPERELAHLGMDPIATPRQREHRVAHAGEDVVFRLGVDVIDHGLLGLAAKLCNVVEERDHTGLWRGAPRGGAGGGGRYE